MILIGAPAVLLGGCHGLGHGGFRIVHEGLREKHDLLVEFAQAALDHLLDDLGRLAGLFRLLGKHRALALDESLVEAVDIEALRIGGSDMHGDLAAEGS